MKKQFLVTLIVGFSLNSVAQSPCSKLPGSAQLYFQLSQVEVDINPLNFRLNCNVNDSIRVKLLALLTEHSQCKVLPQKSNKEDSINEKSPVNNNVIKTVAFLKMKEAIPILEKALTDSSLCLNLPTVELALARLGNQKLENKIIDTLKPNFSLDGFNWIDDFRIKGQALSFINSQESIFQLSYWLDVTKTYDYVADRIKGKSAYMIVGYLKEIILNKDFQEILKGKDLTGVDISDNQLIIDCKNWIFINKGKYQSNSNYYIY